MSGSDNDVQVTLGAEISGFTSGMRTAAQDVDAFTQSVKLSQEEGKQLVALMQQGIAPTQALTQVLNSGFGNASATARAAAVDFQAIINPTTGIGAASKSAADSAQFFEGVLGTQSARAREVREAMGEAGLAIGNIGLSSSQAVNGARALMDELAAGRVRQATGTFTRLFSEIAQANPILAAATAAVLALGAGFVELVLHAHAAEEALDGVHNAMILIGQGSHFSADATRSFISDLEQQAGIGQSAADTIAVAMARIPKATDDTRRSLGELSGTFAKLSGSEPAKAAEVLAKAFSSGADGILNFGKGINLFTEEQKAALEQAKLSNDVYAAQAIGIDALNKRFGEYTNYLKELKSYTDVQSMTEGVIIPGLEPPKLPDFKSGAAEDPVAAARQASVEKYLQVDREIKAVEQDIANIKQQQAGATTQDAQAQAATALQQAETKLRALQQQAGAGKSGGVDVVTQLKAQLAEQDAATTQSLTEELQAHISFWQNVLKTQHLTASQRIEVERQVANEQKQLSHASAQEHISSLDVELAATRQGSQERIDILQRQSALVRAEYGASSTQYMQAEAKVTAAQREAEQERLREKIATLDAEAAQTRQGSQQRITILMQETALVKGQYGEQSREYQDALRKQLDAERQFQQQVQQLKIEGIDAQQQLRLLDLQNIKSQNEVDVALGRQTETQKIASLRTYAAQEYQIKAQAVQQQLALLAQSPDTDPKQFQRLNNQLLVLKKQYANQMNQIDLQEVNAAKQHWQSIISPVTSAFSQITSGILQGTQTWQQAIGNFAVSMVTTLINAGEQWLESYLIDLIVGQTAHKAAAATQISTDAATGAAGAYSSASSIPYVGWIIAPAAAAAAFSAITAFGSGFAVGTPNVPQDMMATVHRGEIIVPATMSDAIRRGSLTLGGPGGGNSTGGPMHVHLHSPMFYGDMSRAASQRTGADLLRDIQKAMRDNPSLRPA